ncbi:aminodeoxychorismate synthase component I [Saccharopolyspora sp. NPDC050389]|uniref:aminodeoxychorismate synthase component I n=1 Tax=Saccharopolyspora sp. NPDC050389 TaxID=3155516 RepID=UPI00340610C2
MRTLIIDNYDSFTYNLADYLAVANGEQCEVIRNDDPAFRLRDLEHFDNVVLSPGPGRPERASDFGIGADIIRYGELPLLGVCLGYQGLCSAHGGTVGPAPEVRHGRLSPVFHMGESLFDAVPSPFSAVRYHSLVVVELSDDLVADAWTSDGVLMGVHHANRPQWGVQFHPESICTEHGDRILRNFADLTRLWQYRAGRRPRPPRQRRPIPSPDRAPSTARFRVLVEELAGWCAPERVFDRLYRSSEHSFWLDSSLSDSPNGRFSFMGDATGRLARVAEADTWRGTTVVRSVAGTDEIPGTFLDWLEADLDSLVVEVPPLPFDFALGWVGYLGYELKSECGGRRVHRAETPDAAMIFADRAIAFDHHECRAYLLALAEVADEMPARRWLGETEAKWNAMCALNVALVVEPEPAELVTGFELRHDKRRYLDLIEKSQCQIQVGETYEVCLTNMACGHANVDPWDSYRFLRTHNPAPFAALLRFGALSVLSTSPERFLRISTDRVAESKPIKGTRPRSDDPHEDRRLREELLASEKDRAENLMIVDLVRNDLGTCAEPGSVHVHKLFDIESFATVHQLVSTVRARLRADASPVSCVRAAFPGGSMTGAPKIRTMQIIDELEEGPRGVYSGALGYFSLSGASDHSIVIRTLVVDEGRVSFGVGGAITALSDPDEEWEETAVKATGLLRLFGERFPDRDVVLSE